MSRTRRSATEESAARSWYRTNACQVESSHLVPWGRWLAIRIQPRWPSGVEEEEAGVPRIGGFTEEGLDSLPVSPLFVPQYQRPQSVDVTPVRRRSVQGVSGSSVPSSLP